MRRHFPWIIGLLLGSTSCASAGPSLADNAKKPPKAVVSAEVFAADIARGEKAFEAKAYLDAAKAFERAVNTDPKNGRAWARLAASLHAANEFTRAAAAWQKAVDINKSPFAMYNLACAHARAGHVDDAVHWLEQSLNAGFTGGSNMRQDADLAILTTNPKFIALAEKAERLAAPCKFDAEFKQFDFWLGEWDVYTPAGQKAGENIVFGASNGCLVVENWTGGRGDSGKSLNFYDPTRKQWRQIWVGSVGGISEYVGEFKDGAMRFVGDPRASTDTAKLQRLTFFLIGPDEVRQLAERSTDSGKTWNPQYDFTYKRRIKKDAAPAPTQNPK